MHAEETLPEECGFHPIVKPIQNELERTGELCSKRLSKAKKRLSRMDSDGELGWAVESMVGLAFLLEEAGRSQDAEAVLSVSTSSMERLLDEPAAKAQLELVNSARKFARFSAQRRASGVNDGETNPEGSVKLTSLPIPPRRV